MCACACVCVHPDLSLCGGAVEAQVLSLQAAVYRQTVKNHGCVRRRRLGVLLLTNTRQNQVGSNHRIPETKKVVCVFCACHFTWLWMLRRFSRWKSQGRMDLSGAKVCRGGMPRRLGRTGSASASWFRKVLVM